MTRYLLDTNVFIEAKNRYYSFDICPAFWGWLAAASKTKTVASIKRFSGNCSKVMTGLLSGRRITKNCS